MHVFANYRVTGGYRWQQVIKDIKQIHSQEYELIKAEICERKQTALFLTLRHRKRSGESCLYSAMKMKTKYLISDSVHRLKMRVVCHMLSNVPRFMRFEEFSGKRSFR